MRFERVDIVGVGLIGGSFALALKNAGLAGHVTGWDSHKTLEKAMAAGIIDEAGRVDGFWDLSRADLVYLAAPVGAIINFLDREAGSLKPGAIVTDAGSTKREICRAAKERLRKDVHFVGGHPLAGSHLSGVEYAQAGLFEGAPYAIVTADNGSEAHEEAFGVVTALVRAIGAVPVRTTAAEHDRTVARFSHAPQLLSTALALAAAGSEEAPKLSGSGFSDMTRLAMSQYSIWEDICRTNADEIAAALGEVINEVEAIMQSLRSGELFGLRERFEAARALAEEFHRARQ